MEVKTLKNKEGEILKTKKGVEMKELKFEIGDEFVPLRNKVFERTNEANVRGSMQQITTYSIICKVRTADKKPFMFKNNEGEETDEVFVTLTPTQAESLKTRINAGEDITQTVFNAYRYNSKKFGAQIGVGPKKDFKKPISFDEYDSKEAESPKEPVVDKPVEGAPKVDSDNEFADLDADIADL